MRLKSLVVSMAFLLIALSAPASAHVQEKADPNDTLSPLDLSSVVTSHGPFNLFFRIQTFDGWSKKAFRRSLDDPTRIQVHLDTRGKRWADYVVEIYVSKGEFKGGVFKLGSGRRVGYASNITKPQPDALRFSVSRDLVDAERERSYRWRVTTIHAKGSDRTPWFWHSP